MDDKMANLKRPVYPMPEDVRAALVDHKLMVRYQARPGYQQNDYIGWINRARRPETRQKRLDQMLAELEHGDRYMKMKYSGE